MTALLADALRWYQAGAMPLPVAPDGTKRPGVHTWKQWQDARAEPADVVRLFEGADSDGLGVITGASSGGLEMLEAEGRAVAEGILGRLEQAFADHAMSDLWDTIHTGYVEVTPSSGIHWYYRVAGPAAGNTKLARRLATDAELEAKPGERIKVLLETRGQGGFSVVAPSAGRTHPTGAAWRAVTGSPDSIPTITGEQRDAIHAIASTLDAMPEPEPVAAPAGQATDAGERPGDDFNARASWVEILEPHGWTLARRYAGKLCAWTRPGKRPVDGVSATTGRNDADNLYVFSSSTEFDTERPYSKFGAYALLEHGGDYSAAASALRAAGYGAQQDARPSLTLLPSDGAQATVTAIGTTVLHRVADPTATLYAPDQDAVALQLAAEAGHRLRYCVERERWLAWTGARWEWDATHTHREAIKDIVRRLPATGEWKAIRRSFLASAGVRGIATMASSDPRIVTHISDLDALPWQLNTPTGAIDLRTGRLHEPDPDALHTRSTTVAPDFEMPAPLWERFLATTFGGNAELIGHVQRVLGVACVGQVLEQVLPFWWGSGANGKSVLIETIMSILGRGDDGYSRAIAAEMLMMRKHSEHPTELAQLAGVRLAVASEIEDGTRFAEARIKQLTGGDSISARFMRADYFTFQPTHSIILVGNHKPMATVGGPAFWRRILLTPFGHVVPESERDPDLPHKLAAEHPAILAWLARGAAAYAMGGLATPAAVKAATADYAASEDTIGRFVTEQCHLAPHAGGIVQCRTSALRAAYERFCLDAGDQPASARRLTQELRDRFGVEARKGAKGARYYSGVDLLNVADDDE